MDEPFGRRLLVKEKLALVLTPDLKQPGGVTNYFRTLRLNDLPRIDYFQVNRYGTSSLLAKVWCAAFIFVSFARVARSYSVIHVNPSLNRNSYYRDMVFVWLSRRLGADTLVFFRGWDEHFESGLRRSRFQRALFRRTYARATAFAVLGESFRQRLLSLGVDSAKPIHLETTVASDEGAGELDVEAKLASSHESFRFLFLSRVLREKGVYIAIDAFAACRRALRGRRMSLHIAGDGPELRFAREYVAAKNLSDVVFEGEVSGLRKANLLKTCHVMLFPTFYGEGLPNCVLEGMLFGLPIVTRGVGGIPEVVKHNVNGFLSDSLDANEFGGMLTTLVEDAARLRKIAIENRSVALHRFTPDVVRERLQAIYLQTVSEQCAA
jgi:glycosyltransferase involved in cell wall biosynthesis